MKTIRLFTLLAILTSLSACEKPAVAPETPHNPLKGTVWENSYYETPGGEFDSYVDRLLFNTDTTGEIVSIVSIVYYHGDNPGDTWDTTTAMTYRFDTETNDLYITSHYYSTLNHLKYNAEQETLTMIDGGRVFVRIM